MGIRVEEFWKLNFRKLHPYIVADNIKRERENYMMWLQGLYIYDAVGAVVGSALSKPGRKKPEYLKEPIRITPYTEAEKRQKQQEEIDKFLKYLDQFERKQQDGTRQPTNKDIG